MSKTSNKNQPSFDLSIEKLEEIVEKMENSDLPLEESIKLFEKGVELSKQCQTALKTAEGKIQKLLDNGNTLGNFEEEEKSPKKE